MTSLKWPLRKVFKIIYLYSLNGFPEIEWLVYHIKTTPIKSS